MKNKCRKVKFQESFEHVQHENEEYKNVIFCHLCNTCNTYVMIFL